MKNLLNKGLLFLYFVIIIIGYISLSSISRSESSVLESIKSLSIKKTDFIINKTNTVYYYIDTFTSYLPFGSINEANTLDNLNKAFYKCQKLNSLSKEKELMLNASTLYISADEKEYDGLILNIVCFSLSIVVLIVCTRYLNKIKNVKLRKTLKNTFYALFIANYLVMTSFSISKSDLKKKIYECYYNA